MLEKWSAWCKINCKLDHAFCCFEFRFFSIGESKQSEENLEEDFVWKPDADTKMLEEQSSQKLKHIASQYHLSK